MKKKKVIILSSICLVFLTLLGFIGYNFFFVPSRFNPHQLNYREERQLNEIISKEDALYDFDELVKQVENVHPIFIDGTLDKTFYEISKNLIRSKIYQSMTILDFKVIASKYMTLFKDGHTKISWYNANKVLDCEIDYIDGKLVLIKNDKNLIITEFNGKPVEEVYSFIDSILPSENESGIKANYSFYSKVKSVLDIALDMETNDIEFTFEDGTKEIYPFIDYEINYETNKYYFLGDTFIVDFNECYIDENLHDIVNNMKKAKENGIKDFIIDARNNPGGNSNACKMLLEALDMEAPKYGILTRCSKEVSYQIGYLKSFGTYETSPSNIAKKNENINLYALSDRNTFSSATMLLCYIRDGHLRTIIGEGSANKPCCYGDIYQFQLSNSNLIGTISHKKFLRPSGDTSEDMLVPDYITSSSNALNKALELIDKE